MLLNGLTYWTSWGQEKDAEETRERVLHIEKLKSKQEGLREAGSSHTQGNTSW